MTPKVKITIEGSQPGVDQEVMTTLATGDYYLKNGTRYILFEESQEGFDQTVKNTIKIKENQVELTKKGLISSHMVFGEGLTYLTEYVTPYGNILLDLSTQKLEIQEREQDIEIQILYGIDMNGEFLSDSHIHIKIEAL